jgi:hypothetical protein
MFVLWLAKMGDSYGKIQEEFQAYWRLEQANILCELYPRKKDKSYFESGDLVSVRETEGDDENIDADEAQPNSDEDDEAVEEESYEAQTHAVNEEQASLLASARF